MIYFPKKKNTKKKSSLLFLTFFLKMNDLGVSSGSLIHEDDVQTSYETAWQYISISSYSNQFYIHVYSRISEYTVY